MTFFTAIFLGLLQGATEFLPVSSSGQLFLFEHFFGISIDEKILQSFDVFLHFGSFCALLILFRREVLQILKFIFSKIKILISNFKRENSKFENKISAVKLENKKFKKIEIENGARLFSQIFFGTLPLLFFGIFVEKFLIDSIREIFFVAGFLIFTAILFFIAEKFSKKNREKIENCDAFKIGFWQILGLFPGISRSGILIVGGLLQNFKREVAARFAFLLAMPAIFGATILAILQFEKSFFEIISPEIFITGFFASAISSFFFAKFLLKIFRQISLKFFAIFLICESVAALFLQNYLANIFGNLI